MASRFRLSRFFVLNFILLEILIVGVGGTVSYRLGRKHLIDVAQQNSVAVAKHLAFVLDEFYMKPWELTFETYPYDHPLAYNELRSVVLNFLSGFQVKRVNIFNNEYRIVFSTDSTMIGEEHPDNSLLLSALAGNAISELNDNTTMHRGEEPRDYLDAYIPINARTRTEATSRLAFEIYLDVTEAYSSVKDLRLTIILSMTFIGLALLAVVLLISKRADKLILAENAERMRLAEQVRRHNEELEQIVDERTKQLREAQSGLIQMEKMAATGSLAAGVAHEINNPVSIIQNRLEILLEDAKHKIPIEGLDEHLAMMHKHTSRISRIVSKLLSFARNSTKERADLNMHDLLSGVVLLVGKEIEKRGIKLISEFPKSLPAVHGNSTELEQVFINLLINAMDACQSGGEIRFIAAAQPDRLRVQVQDNGSGIPDDKLSKVFDPFFTTKGVGAGTGLGLSITYRIVKDHDGDISVTSSPGHGTTFTVTFPLA